MMPRPDPREPVIGQEALFEPESTADRRKAMVTRGRHAEAMDRSLLAAHRQGLIGEVDEGAASLLRAVGTNVDEAEARRDLWALSKLLPPSIDLLDRLRMTPGSRAEQTSDLDEKIKALTDAFTQLDPTGPVSHAEEPGPA